MLKFFRSLRQKMLNESKTSKYLLYAFGEILLVVIGILIALQINNWNQNRLNLKEEQRILIAISEEMQLDKFLIENGQTLQKNKMQSAVNLLNEIQNQTKDVDREGIEKELNLLTKRWLSGTETSIYDALIGSGDLKLITSEDLRNELVHLKSNQEFLGIFEEKQTRFEDDKLNPFLNQYINRSAILLSNDSKSAYDIPLLTHQPKYNDLFDNLEFSNLLIEMTEHTHRVLSTYGRLVDRVNAIDSIANLGIEADSKLFSQ